MTDSDLRRSLPSRPDSTTGLPRPPHAPGFAGDPGAKARDHEAARRLRRTPTPPPDSGPALVWYRIAWTTTARTAAVVAVLVVLAVGIIALADPAALALAAGIAVLAGLLAVAAQIAWPVRRDRCVIGADWLLYRGVPVRTYDLAEISTEPGEGGTELTLVDADGHIVETTFTALQRDRRVWDYLYNGIRHSIAGGAQLHGTARQYFVVGLPPRAAQRDPDPA